MRCYMRESQIQSKILTYLNSLDAWTVKLITTNKSGAPDIVGCLQGHFIAIEVKRPGQKPRPLQLYQIEQIRRAGGVAFYADSVEKVKKYLSKYVKNAHIKEIPR